MKALFSFAVIVTFGWSIGVAATLPKELKNRKDGELILGRWKQDGISVLGKEQINNGANVFQFTAEGKCGCSTGPIDFIATYELDQSETPPRMKWTAPGNIWQCVYELEGDKLVIAFVEPNTELPKKLESANNLTIYTLSRIKD